MQNGLKNNFCEIRFRNSTLTESDSGPSDSGRPRACSHACSPGKGVGARDSGFGVQELACAHQVLGLRIPGLGFRDSGLVSGDSGLVFGDSGLRLRGSCRGLGLRDARG